jgi:hypothetical protein
MNKTDFYEFSIEKGDIKLYPAGIPKEIVQFATNNNCVLHPVNMFALASLVDSDPTHRACLDIKTMMVSGLGYQFLNKKAEKNKDFKKFIDSPNMDVFMTFQDLLTASTFDFMVFGNTYLDFIQVGKQKALYHLIARDVYIKPKKIGGVAIPRIADSYYQILSGGNQHTEFRSLMDGETVKKAQHYLAHFYQYTPVSSYYGLPSYLPAIQNISENVLIRNHGIRFFSNSARPDLALLISNGDVSDKEIEKIKTQLSTYHKGIENAHRFFVFSIEGENAKVELKEISKTIDGQFLKESEKNRDEIARIHQIPPKVLGISSAGSLGSGSETIGALKNFVETSIKPLQLRYESFINKVLYIMFGFNPEIKFNQIDLTNEKDDAIIYSMLSRIVDINGKPAMTVTEIREKLSLPVEPEGALMVKPASNDKLGTDSTGKPKAGVALDQQSKIETLDEETPKIKPN